MVTASQEGRFLVVAKQFSYENLSRYRTVLMGLQIILIICFHFAVDGYYVRDSRIIYLFYKYIRSSGVDMFLLLSGVGLYFSWKKTPVIRTFYLKRYTRILIPYFLVAIPAWIWLDVFYLNAGWGKFFEDLFFLTDKMVLVHTDDRVLLSGISVFVCSCGNCRRADHKKYENPRAMSYKYAGVNASSIILYGTLQQR